MTSRGDLEASGSAEVAPPTDAPRPRRPYASPQLVRLGSVRDLMLGQSVGFPEGAGTFVKPM